jgi:transcriptional regulator with XRE-family HTH domain
MTLGKRIKHFRHKSGFSLREMESRTGIKKEYLCRIETDSLPNPTYKTLQSIVQGLDIDIVDLFVFSPPATPKVSVISATEFDTNYKADNLVAIPIITPQLACRRPLDFSNQEFDSYVLINPSVITNITKFSMHAALYLDKADDSMSPAVPAGALLCVDFGSHDLAQLEDKMVLIKVDNEQCRIAYLKLKEDFYVGVPHNIKNHSPFLIPRHKTDAVLGKIVGCLSCIPSS